MRASARFPVAAKSRTYYNRKPGYWREDCRAMFAKVTDWAFMKSHCRHSGKRHNKACKGIGHNFALRPECAK